MVAILPDTTAPSASAMVRTLSDRPRVHVQRTRNRFVQRWCGCCCPARREYSLSPDDPLQREPSTASGAGARTHDDRLIEESGICVRALLGSMRPFRMRLFDSESRGGGEFFVIKRPLRCGVGAGKCCCGQEAVALDGGGAVVGTVREGAWMWPCVPPHFVVLDHIGKPTLDVRSQSPCLGACCCVCCDHTGVCECLGCTQLCTGSCGCFGCAPKHFVVRHTGRPSADEVGRITRVRDEPCGPALPCMPARGGRRTWLAELNDQFPDGTTVALVLTATALIDQVF